MIPSSSSPSPLISQYNFSGTSTIPVVMGFTSDDQLFARTLRERFVPLKNISSITLRKCRMTSRLETDKLRLDIKTLNGAGENKFQSLRFDITDEEAKLFLRELKKKIPSTCIIDNQMQAREIDLADITARRSYPLQSWWFMTKAVLVGHSRTSQILFNNMTILIFLLVFASVFAGNFFIGLGVTALFATYLLLTYHKITTDENFIRIKKNLLRKSYRWEDVAKIDIHRYTITVTRYGSAVRKSHLLDCTLIATNGKKKNFLMRTLEGKQFVREMVMRKKTPAFVEDLFI
ncbi:MAG: hypothetical protein HY064_09985 [Bacteroidetes bacterium]|nr:hypothetical protein [Bacteroidota bacterium]